MRVDGDAIGGMYRRGQFTVLSRGHDMMKKAHEEAAAYRLHFKRCPGVGVCQDIGHPGGPRRSAQQALADKGPAPTEPVVTSAREQQPVKARPGSSEPVSVPTGDWAAALRPIGRIASRELAPGVAVRVVPLEFEQWPGPPLGMAEDCNKRGGRVIGDRGELSCAEVEIVKRLRTAGWGAAWYQAFKCGRRRWSQYINDGPHLPEAVRHVQEVAGTGVGHPDVVAWRGERVVAIGSKGASDSVRASQVEWFGRALEAGVAPDDIALVQWTVSPASATTRAEQPVLTADELLGPRFLEAVAYAAELHAGQMRKKTTIPYLSHLLAVCSLVLEDGGTEDEAIGRIAP